MPPLTADTVDVVRLVGTSAASTRGLRSGLRGATACGKAGAELCSQTWLSLLVLLQLAHDAVEGAQTLLVVSEAPLSAREAVLSLF